MTRPEYSDAADEYKALIHKRTGIASHELACPREKSDMTPCVARDGGLAVTDSGHCAGCDCHVTKYLLAKERTDHP